MHTVPFILIAAVAAPAVALPTDVLPVPPRGIAYVEARCSGGIAGIDEQVRILANGEITQTMRRTGVVMRATATPTELRGLWRKLDVARFERRTVRGGLYPPDGITCVLIRRQNGRQHEVVMPQDTRNEGQVADLRSVIADVSALGQRAAGPALQPALD